MALFLAQHGKSLSKDIDPEQGLSEEGIMEVERIAQVAKGYKAPVALIKHSVKKRAQQTAEIFAEALVPDNGIEEMAGLKPMDDFKAIAEGLDHRENLMLVGHLPFMQRLTGLLTAGNPDLTVMKFQNGGLICLDKDPDADLWFIKWTLMPNIA